MHLLLPELSRQGTGDAQLPSEGRHGNLRRDTELEQIIIMMRNKSEGYRIRFRLGYDER